MLAPGDSTVVELTFDTRTYKTAVRKNATIYSNDLANSQFRIYVNAKVFETPDSSLSVRWSPDKVEFSQGNRNGKVTVTNTSSQPVKLTSAGERYDNLNMTFDDELLKPGETADIDLGWNGEFEKENFARSLTFTASGNGQTVFSIPFVVEGTNPTPEPVKKPVQTKELTGQRPTESKSVTPETGKAPAKAKSVTPEVKKSEN